MHSNSPLQTLHHPLFTHHQIKVFIKRDDLIHPILSGNKWRKLMPNIQDAIQLKKSGILSFGGAYSNHIHALAFACKEHQLKSIGIIRGESQYHDNFTLAWAQHWGMQCQFVDRTTYQQRDQHDFLTKLAQAYPDYLLVPEGGSNHKALIGVGEIIKELNQQVEFDTLITPVGSGGTLAGLISTSQNQYELLGIAVLKQAEYLKSAIHSLLSEQAKRYNNWQLITDLHRGGYGKFSPQDCQQIIDFSQHCHIDFEPIYSGKMLLGFLDLLSLGYFKAKQRIVLLHTGGLQGLGGMVERNMLDGSQWNIPKSAPYF